MVYDTLMASTLRAIAENGADEMYTGETARRLIQDIQENGGFMVGFQTLPRKRTVMLGRVATLSFRIPGLSPKAQRFKKR